MRVEKSCMVLDDWVVVVAWIGRSLDVWQVKRLAEVLFRRWQKRVLFPGFLERLRREQSVNNCLIDSMA